MAGGQYPVGDALTEKVVERVGKRLEKVTFNGKISWHHFSGEDRELVRVALLHDTYHRCCLNFDDLILKQIEADHSACLVPFAKDNLLLLRKRGFNVEDSLRYFGFFYQMRRAWYFINHGLIGQSGSMDTLRAQLWRTVFTSRLHWYENFLWNRMEDFSTFLIGETGTGKGTAAAAIGRSGFIPFDEKKGCFIESFASNFIGINLSQFPESLIESELFGHKKGAFTGAVDSHKGVFALCSPHGSIFLDEIGDISIPIQIKLLKVLEERNFSAVGSHEKLHFHGRIVTATNKSLAVLQQQQTFREDFYYRLCSNIIPFQPSANKFATIHLLLKFCWITLSCGLSANRHQSYCKSCCKYLRETLDRIITGQATSGNLNRRYGVFSSPCITEGIPVACLQV